MTIPAQPTDACWPVSTDHCKDFDTYPEAVQEVAKGLAGETLRMLTGYTVGGCPVLMRPSTVRCAASAGWQWVGGTFTPMNMAGVWTNATCCGFDCPHTSNTELRLPAPVGLVLEVKVDGVVLPSDAYTLADGTTLVRTDGGTWPLTQDLTKTDDEPGTFAITYLAATPVDTAGAAAAGTLACEYAKALAGQNCALPKSVTQITRQGVSMQLTPGAFPDGMTGLRDVDAYVMRHNPYKLKTPPMVWSPDLRRGRRTTDDTIIISGGGA